MVRNTLLAASMLAAPPLAAAGTPSPYRTPTRPIYTCTNGDNSVALNGLLAAGGEVDLAAGKCRLAIGLVMPVPGTTLHGAGRGRTVLLPMRPGAIDLVTVGLGSPTYAGGGFTISNLTTNGLVTGPANPNAAAGHGIRVTGGVHADRNSRFGLVIVDVETSYGVGGVSIARSDVTATGLDTHHNRRSGFFVESTARMPAPYNIASRVTLRASTAANNNLDNAPGRTWDNVDFSSYTAHGTVGGPNAGDGNTVIAGDILFGCPPDDLKCARPTGPFLAQGNTVTNTGAMQAVGIRAYGRVAGVVFDRNTITAAQTGIALMGSVTGATVSNNAVSGPSAYGVEIAPLAGAAPGDTLTVSGNNVTMKNPNKPAFSVIRATNVTLRGDNGHGAPYATSQAGAGLVMGGNR